MNNNKEEDYIPNANTNTNTNLAGQNNNLAFNEAVKKCNFILTFLSFFLLILCFQLILNREKKTFFSFLMGYKKAK